MDAAVREVYEETGFDSRGIIKEKWYLEAQVNGSEAKMYIIPGVPEDTHFEPKTRKEIRVSHLYIYMYVNIIFVRKCIIICPVLIPHSYSNIQYGTCTCII